MAAIEGLASYRRLSARLALGWPEFAARRRQRLAQADRFGHAAEKVAENILEDLFTGPLDWALGDVNYQIDYADLELTRLGIKHLLVEVKRPGSLAWNRRALELALGQAAGYARLQKVASIAVSDGHLLYAADVGDAGLHDRAFVALDLDAAHPDLWWLSVDGIYRRRDDLVGGPGLLPIARSGDSDDGRSTTDENTLLHPRYAVPAACFAYVVDPRQPHTWHLPYRRADGSVDVRRLPKAIEAILSNYRGAHASSIPESAIPDVLVCLGRAASEAGRMPGQAPEPAPAYVALARALDQMGRLVEIDLR
jgi:hypothetical protein